MRIRSIRTPALSALVMACLSVCACKKSEKLHDALDYCPNPIIIHHQLTPEHPKVMSLAHDLDKVEKYIDWYGTVVPKAPDVWGQARLTQHREEFEDVMSADLYSFEVRMNGALSRTDDAFAGQAVALAAAVQPRPRFSIFGGTDRTEKLNTSQNVNINGATGTRTVEETRAFGTKLSQQQLAPPAASILKDLPTTSKSTVTYDPATGAVQKVENENTGAIATIPADSEKSRFIGLSNSRLPDTAIALEPTLVLEQKARYLNLLNQIRRTNEGDDTADSPGYSMNLMRIPVSIFPGTRTEASYGAEINFSLNPILGEDLLPSTFRSFVVNDLVNHLSFPLAKYLESSDSATHATDHQNHTQTLQNEDTLMGLAVSNNGEATVTIDINESNKKQHGAEKHSKPTLDIAAEKVKSASRIKKAIQNRIAIPTLAPSKGLLARAPIPNSQILDVFGIEFADVVAYEAYQTFEKEIKTHGYAHVPDIQSHLQSELNAAYRFLESPSHRSLWTDYCRPELVEAVRNRDVVQLAKMRRSFREYFGKASGASDIPQERTERMKFSVTAALAWCILVDSALLTDRLVRDMKETATAKGRGAFTTGWLDFAYPNPSPEARQAFAEYVRCRWPIHVFALDPANQEQNLVDELTTRRETQLALALAFVSGQINANTLTRYNRRLEARYETIALNRTQVGFSHGESNFGWRFYPRFQSPGGGSKLQALLEDKILGDPSQDQLLRERRLEPGMRECVAIVLMPSFVPYVTTDSVTNWFALSNPKHKEFDLTEAMRVSRAIKSLQVHGPNVQDGDLYRDGDVQRLLRRVDQLEARLPTQTQTVQIPVINTLGGFEMFNSGTTDLAPDLYGFYGAPGVQSNDVTSLFLVGDHFSPLRTKVIIGNVECKVRMLSRQVVQVFVPPLSLESNDGYVQAHLATPYGVTREIRIPYVRNAAEPKSQLFLQDPTWAIARKVVVTKKDDKDSYLYQLEPASVQPLKAKLNWAGISDKTPESIKVILTFKIGNTGDLNKDVFVFEQTIPRTNKDYLFSVNDMVKEMIKFVNTHQQPNGVELGKAPFYGTFKPLSVKVVDPQDDKVAYTLRSMQEISLVVIPQVVQQPKPVEPKKEPEEKQ